MESVTNILVESFEDDKLIFSYYDTTHNVNYRLIFFFNRNQIARVQITSLKSSNYMDVLSEITVGNYKFIKMSYRSSYLLLQDDTQALVYSFNFDSYLSLDLDSQITGSVIAADFVYYEVSLFNFLIKLINIINRITYTLYKLLPTHTATL